MSKVAIAGNASGTGTFTIQAPNSNTDRTLVLPDEAGTVLTDTAPSVSGDITFNQEASGSPYPEQQIKWSNDSTTANGFYISQDSNRNGRIWHEQGLELLFGTNNTERMRIDASGEAKFLGNNGASTFASYESNDGVIQTYESGQGWHHRCVGDFNGTKYGIGFYYGDTTLAGYISFTNTTTSYATSSDYRLKENVVDMTGAIDRVKSLKPSQFNFIVDPDNTVDGFIAHEVQDIVPEAVTGEKDAVDADGNPVYQGIDQSKLVPLLTGALQEAIARIETLEAEVATLKGASA